MGIQRWLHAKIINTFSWINGTVEERIVSRLIETMNSHLPKRRMSLKELLEMESPHIECRDGSLHYFEERELEFISRIIPAEEHERLFLPVILEMTTYMGSTVVFVRDRLHQYVIRTLLDIPEKEGDLIIYLPEVREVRRKLPTTTQYMFRISSR